MVWGKGLTTFFCKWLYSFPITISWRDYPPPMCSLGSLINDHLTVYVRIYFWDLYLIPLRPLSVFIPVPYCVDYCSFLIYFETRKCEASSFIFLFFKIAMVLSLSLFFWNCVWILAFFFFLQKNAIGILIGIALNLYVGLNSMVI